MDANRICKCQSLIFPENNEPTTSLTIIDFRPSRLAMLNFSGNAWSGEDGRESKVWRRLGTRWEAWVERFTDFLSRIPRGTGRSRCWEMQFGHRISFSLDKSAVEQLRKRDEIRSRPLLTVGRNIVGNFCVRRETFA